MDRALGFPIADVDALERTDVLQDALIRCLDVLGEAVKRLSPKLREQNCDLPCRGRRVGMRDLLIHADDRVDLDAFRSSDCPSSAGTLGDCPTTIWLRRTST